MSPMPSRWRGLLSTAPPRTAVVHPTTSYICSLSAPSDPPMATPPAAEAATVSAEDDPQVLVDTALDDAVDELLRGAVLRVPGQASLEPAVRALGRARRVVAIDVKRRALVEDQRDVGPQRRLDLHARLRCHEPLGAVEVRAEPHAVLLDRQHAALALAAEGDPPLDLVSHGSVAHAEDLEAARVGDDRRVPAHEPMQPAEVLDQLLAGLEHQVEGVAEDHLVAEGGDLGGLQALDRGLGRQRDERRRAQRAVGGAQHPGPRARARVACRDRERGHWSA